MDYAKACKIEEESEMGCFFYMFKLQWSIGLRNNRNPVLFGVELEDLGCFRRSRGFMGRRSDDCGDTRDDRRQKRA